MIDLRGVDPGPLPNGERLASVWLRRAAAELGVAQYVRTMMSDLRDAGASDAVLALGARTIADEDLHARVCHEIGCVYARSSRPLPEPLHGTFEPLDRFPQPLRASLRVLGMCCIGESMAAVWMDHSHATTNEPWLKTWVRRHYADEVHHAQLGWAHFASDRIDDRTRAVASTAVVGLARANVRSWLQSDFGWDDDLEEHGIPSRARTEAIVAETLWDIVVPGLERVGIDSAPLRAALPQLLASATHVGSP